MIHLYSAEHCSCFWQQLLPGMANNQQLSNCPCTVMSCRTMLCCIPLTMQRAAASSLALHLCAMCPLSMAQPAMHPPPLCGCLVGVIPTTSFSPPPLSFSDLYLFHLVNVTLQMCNTLSATRLLAGDKWHPYPAPFPLSMVTIPPLMIHIEGLTVLKPSPSIVNNTINHHCPPSSTMLVLLPAVFGLSRVASCH